MLKTVDRFGLIFSLVILVNVKTVKTENKFSNLGQCQWETSNYGSQNSVILIFYYWKVRFFIFYAALLKIDSKFSCTEVKAQCCIVDWHIRGNQQTIKLQMISPRSGRLVEVHSEMFIRFGHFPLTSSILSTNVHLEHSYLCISGINNTGCCDRWWQSDCGEETSGKRTDAAWQDIQQWGSEH